MYLFVNFLKWLFATDFRQDASFCFMSIFCPGLLNCRHNCCWQKINCI